MPRLQPPPLPHRSVAWLAMLLGGLLGCLLAVSARAQPRISAGEVPAVGIREKVGTTLPLDLPLLDETGRSVTLRDLVHLPTLLLFVYYRCPGICDPLMREVAHNLDQVGLEPGSDYQVITISFDPAETPEVASTKKQEILGTMKQHRPPDGGWRFLTGPEDSVRALTEAAGFHYRYDEATQTYLHASSLIFLTSDGRIVRYLGGLEFVPAELKMALLDAKQGRERSVMQQVLRICFAYDPTSHRYVLQLNRVILATTGVIVLGMIAYLFFTRKRARGASKGAPS